MKSVVVVLSCCEQPVGTVARLMQTQVQSQPFRSIVVAHLTEFSDAAPHPKSGFLISAILRSPMLPCRVIWHQEMDPFV